MILLDRIDSWLLSSGLLDWTGWQWVIFVFVVIGIFSSLFALVWMDKMVEKQCSN